MVQRAIPESEIFMLLGKRRRRLLVDLLQEAVDPISAIDAADCIAQREHEHPERDDVRAIYLSLCQHHLPKLESADVVVYDAEEGSVYPGVNFDTVTRELHGTAGGDLPWSDANPAPQES